ncbi:hypothetical protein INH39_11155 [Massilia violaceinigra]|uniref:Uncharacterized protein n=1 Tax=Massilia violaceinigra TaxID=2045208 RepID=A0ABY4AE03_9BURK|nr:hypothetical protein [Massilia violaceinigra]UOD32169.1 hypothetical protein INH39_11155 [Massilia violaceinigra]
MNNHEVLEKFTVAISISESPDMSALGLSEGHLQDAMGEVARHLLALGAQLVYGGDLRTGGFSQILFELVARHRRDADDDKGSGVLNYLPWPSHCAYAIADLEVLIADLAGSAELVFLDLSGTAMTMAERRFSPAQQPNASQWLEGLTSMREKILATSHARIVLGGRVDGYRGVMPGIAEESLLAIENAQPIYILGGFGGCARDIAETLGLVPAWPGQLRVWEGRAEFEKFTVEQLNNGLDMKENVLLARTPHLDQAIMLILRGIMQLVNTGKI